jgi:hypothetical protein
MLIKYLRFYGRSVIYGHLRFSYGYSRFYGRSLIYGHLRLYGYLRFYDDLGFELI